MINACLFETMGACANLLQTGSRRGSFPDHKEKAPKWNGDDTKGNGDAMETRSIYAETRP